MAFALEHLIDEGIEADFDILEVEANQIAYYMLDRPLETPQQRQLRLNRDAEDNRHQQQDSPTAIDWELEDYLEEDRELSDEGRVLDKELEILEELLDQKEKLLDSAGQIIGAKVYEHCCLIRYIGLQEIRTNYFQCVWDRREQKERTRRATALAKGTEIFAVLTLDTVERQEVEEW